MKEKWGKNKTKNWQIVLNQLILLHGERGWKIYWFIKIKFNNTNYKKYDTIIYRIVKFRKGKKITKVLNLHR